MTDLRQFSKRIKVRADNIGRNVNRLVKKVALVVDQSVVVETPVDTGRAKSNWIVSIGGPTENTILPYSPGVKGSTEAQNTQGALNQGRMVIDSREEGQTIYISNNLDYIGLLNQGSSPQQPDPNYVQRAVLNGIAAIRGIKVVE